MDRPEPTPLRLVNPRTKEMFVLLRADEYKRLKDDEYDDSPWTREELRALAFTRSKNFSRSTSTAIARPSATYSFAFNTAW